MWADITKRQANFLVSSVVSVKYSAAASLSAVIDCVSRSTRDALVASEADEEVLAGHVTDGFPGLGPDSNCAQDLAQERYNARR